MSNNIFNGKRFLLLWKQHFIHNTQFLILSSVVYVGIIFLVLSIAQIIGRRLHPHDLETFHSFLVVFLIIFGLLYAGHSFPAFRTKESAINYLILPASLLEKFLFEFISRVGMIFLVLPLLYWVIFHFQGYFFTMFTDRAFESIGLQYIVNIKPTNVVHLQPVFYTLVCTGILLTFVVVFTGSTIFHKQPLIKTLFSVILIFLFYLAYAYIMVVHVGVRNYAAPEDLWLFPTDELKALWWLCGVLVVAIAVMLFVGYRKLTEKEV